MKPKKIIATVFILILLITTGCSGVKEYSVDNVSPDFDKEKEVSQYIIKKEQKKQSSAVPDDPTLEYVNTEYLINQLKSAAKTSSRKNYNQYPPEWNFVLVDTRSWESFASGHINGAINIPASHFEQYKHLLPEEKDKLLIFYCNGVTCNLSTIAAQKAKELGYINIKVFKQGIPGWLEAGNYLTVTEGYVKNLIMENYTTRLDYPPYLLIDARPYKSYFEAHIPNAIQMDDTTFVQKYLSLAPIDKNAEIIIYCGGFGCSKSHTIADALLANGYMNIKVFSGGLPVWEAAKLPTFGTNSIAGSFDVSEGKVNRAITKEQFVEKLNSNNNVVVLDVRSDEERSNGAISGSIHIPDTLIHIDPKAIVSKLPVDKNTTILIHCASGARAGGVVDKIADLGYKDVFYLNGVILINNDGSYTFE